MNFSALNTHAIGVQQLVTASAVVEGAGSFSAAAGASAQVTLHSHAIAVLITSVAVATTQSVIRFAAATATMGCNAAANTEGYRVQFSNAEIVCTASNDANAVVQRQAVVYVTAQATNVAVGSRVAYASASLQAECNLTANSGKVIFASAITGTNGYWTSGTPAVYGWSHYAGLYVVRTGQNNDVWDIAPGQNYWYSQLPRTNPAQYRTIYPAIAHGYNSSTYYRYQLQNYGIVTAAIAPVFIETAWQPTASLVATATVHTVFYGTADIAASATSSATASNTLNVSGDITASAAVTSSAYYTKYTSANIAGSCAILSTTSGIVAAEFAVAASSNVVASNYVVSDAKGFFTGSSIAISIGAKKAVSQTTLTASAAMSSSANAYRGMQASINATADSSLSTFIVNAATANVVGSCSLAAEVTSGIVVTGNVAASSNVILTPHLILNALGVFTGSSLAISVGNKKAVSQTNINCSASVTTVTDTSLIAFFTAEAQAELLVTANVISNANANVGGATLLSGSDTQTFVVTASGGNYVIANQANRPLDFKVGSTYTFDLSSSSNGAHPLRFSTTNNGIHNGGTVYTDNVTISGTQGQAGSFISIVVTENTPSPLYYYCAYHSGMGSTITVSSANAVSASVITLASSNVAAAASMDVVTAIESAAQATLSANAESNGAAEIVSGSFVQLAASAAMIASSSNNVFVSATISGLAVAISIGNKISIGDAQFNGVASAIAGAYQLTISESAVIATAAVIAETFKTNTGQATLTATASITSIPYKETPALGQFTANADSIASIHRDVFVQADCTATATLVATTYKVKSGQSDIVATASITADLEIVAFTTGSFLGFANTQGIGVSTRYIKGTVQASAELIGQSDIQRIALAEFTATCLVTSSSSLLKEIEAHISGNAVSISIGNKISVTTANLTTANAEVTANAVSLRNSEAVVTAAAITTASAGYLVEAVADISDTSYVVPGYWIPSYDTYTYTTTTATIGFYSPVPSFKSITNPGGTTYYYSGKYQFLYGMYPSGPDYQWIFNPQYQNSTAPTESSTWGSFGPAPAANTSGTYKGALVGNVNHQDSVYIPGLNQVTVYHSATRYEILEDTVTTHTTTHPAVWVGPVTVVTGYGPDAAVSTAYIDVWLGGVSSVAGSANVATVAHLEIPASGLITASASVSSTSLILGQINAIAALNASAEVVTDCIRFVGARGDFLGSNVTISVGENVSFATASIYSGAVVAATSVVETPVNALINASSDVSATIFVTNNLTAAISATASFDGISNVNKAVLALAGFEASGAVTSNAGVIQNDAATIAASASIIAIGGKLVSVTADVSDTGYWTPSYNSAEAYTIPAYDTWVDSLAAAYWVNFTNSQIQIDHTFESIAPYNANTTYNGTNIPTTIINTLNNAAPAGTTFYSQLIQARTRSGVSGYDGGIKRRVTTTHPAVYVPAVVVDGYWTVTGLGPTSNTTATADVLFSATLGGTASVDAATHIEVNVNGSIAANATINTIYAIDVYVEGAFTGSNVTIIAGEILIFASGAIEASATITAEADRSVIAKAFIEGNALFTSQGVGLNVSEARVTASAATVDAEGVVLRYVAVPLNIDATVIITTRFVLLAQEGQRSNGILILVEPENRTLLIEVKKERVIYAKAA